MVSSLEELRMCSPNCYWGNPGYVAFGSALRSGARYEGVPAAVSAGVVSLQLMKGLAMRRTIAHMNPPAAVPHLTRADT